MLILGVHVSFLPLPPFLHMIEGNITVVHVKNRCNLSLTRVSVHL